MENADHKYPFNRDRKYEVRYST